MKYSILSVLLLISGCAAPDLGPPNLYAIWKDSSGRKVPIEEARNAIFSCGKNLISNEALNRYKLALCMDERSYFVNGTRACDIYKYMPECRK